jgi:predicted DNA-binding protein YlxM (UPF0122 family)
MDGATWVSIGSIATSSGVAIAAVWLAARFAYRQAHIGRVWERKAEAYSEILEALHEIEEWFRAEMDDEYSRREVAEEVQASRNAEYQDARKRLRRRIAREVWLLPDETQQRIVAMNAEMSKRQDSWFEHLDNGCCEVRNAVKDITKLAQAELGGPKP